MWDEFDCGSCSSIITSILHEVKTELFITK
jgi:hypothetical protein